MLEAIGKNVSSIFIERFYDEIQELLLNSFMISTKTHNNANTIEFSSLLKNTF